MNTILNHGNEVLIPAPAEFMELVRGTDQRFVAQFSPIIRECNLTLNMAAVHRIDAAGIAALITLYGCARETSHTFHVSNVHPRVAEILGLVGLDHILVTEDAVHPAPPSICMSCPAA